MTYAASVAIFIAVVIEHFWKFVSRVLFGDDDDPPFGFA